MARSIFALLVAVAVLWLAQHGIAQQVQDRDPFASTVEARLLPKHEMEKLVVHLPTFDRCIKWLDINRSIVQSKDRIRQLKRQISQLEDDHESEKSVEIKRMQQQLVELNTTINARLKKLDRIPYDTTFDLERWEKFRQELKTRRQYQDTENLKQEHQTDSAEKEIRRLTDENRALRNELSQLKGDG